MLERGGEGKNYPPHKLTWVEAAEESCAYFMAMGVTPDEYWNGDHSLLKYYRKGYELKRRIDNERAWLQGAYFYDALCKIAPYVKSFSKVKQPEKYRSEPFPLSYRESQTVQKQREERDYQASLAKMTAWHNAGRQRQKESPTKGGE